MKAPIVLLDACVLFPAPLRDFLMHLTLLDVFLARWTEEIHQEWIRNVLEMRPDLTEKQLNRTKDLMNNHVRDCLVEDYENLTEKLILPDKNDRHILAAAIKVNANHILTFNLKDFPPNILQNYGINALSPDKLLSELFETNKEKFCLAFERQLKSLKNPPKSAEELFEILEKQNLKETVRKMKSYVKKSQS
ncbi:MAG: PIN domain-containing protein [Pyrinomonadaceae bacterium]|jgi:predicted nucleic acid-binding protein|nr:PIN domain-containing protein [Pyrinomonadaceae bacterium]